MQWNLERDGQNMYAIEFCYIEVFSYIFYWSWSLESRSLYRGLRCRGSLCRGSKVKSSRVNSKNKLKPTQVTVCRLYRTANVLRNLAEPHQRAISPKDSLLSAYWNGTDYINWIVHCNWQFYLAQCRCRSYQFKNAYNDWSGLKNLELDKSLCHPFFNQLSPHLSSIYN